MGFLTVQQAIDQLEGIGLTSPDPAQLVEHEYQKGLISSEKHINLIDDINKGYKVMGVTPTVVLSETWGGLSMPDGGSVWDSGDYNAMMPLEFQICKYS